MRPIYDVLDSAQGNSIKAHRQHVYSICKDVHKH